MASALMVVTGRVTELGEESGETSSVLYCQARKLYRKDAMDCSRWRKLIKNG